MRARALARGFVTGLCLLLIAAPAGAQATPSSAAAEAPALQDSPTEEALAAFLRTQTDALGRTCAVAQLARSGELRFVACGPAGLWTVRVNGSQTSLVEIRDVGGSAIGLFSAEDQLWVKVSSVRAQPLPLRGTLAPSAQLALAQPSAARTTLAPATMPVRVAALPPTRGKLVAREDAVIVIEVPPGAQPPSGARIAFSKPESDGASEDQGLVVGRVISHTTNRAKVVIGMNERVPTDATARVTDAPTTASTFAPPRAAGIWEMSFLARPFLVLDDLGVGGVLDAQVGYRMRAPVHFEAALTPLAFGTARAGATATYAGMVMAAFDSHLFEAGLGLGIQSVNDPNFGVDRGSGTLIAERLRIGARDGAYLELQTYVALFHRSFEFSSLRVTGQIPLGARTWLHAAGGGGTMGMASGELGVRLLLAGNGGSGSAFVTALVGWAEVYRSCNVVSTTSNCVGLDYTGPMLGAGAEFRR